MKQSFVLLNSARLWKIGLPVFAVVLSAIFLLYSERVNAQLEQNTPPANSIYAPLSGERIGGIAPYGVGKYFVYSNGTRVFETFVDRINLPAGTNLSVFHNGNSVGQITLSPMRNGRLLLSTGRSDSVPTIASGDSLTVKNGDTVIVSGTFGTPPPPPPAPSSAFYAHLTGSTIEGVMPRGVSHYAEFTSSRKLGVFVSRVNLPAGTQLNVLINGASVGQITLRESRDGGIRLDSANGDSVPVITAGSTAEVKNGTTTILSGTFRAVTQTPPNPPMPNRFFGGRLSGRQVVPPVTTDARGLIGVALNSAETQIKVHLGFINLSSEQLTATINGPALPGETGPVIFDLGAIGGTQGRFPERTFDVTAEQVEQLRNGLWYVQIGSVEHPDGEIRGRIRSRARHSNFLGDETDDISVFRPSNGVWYIKTPGGLTAQTFGGPSDRPVSGDYDGDGKTDAAVYRNGLWYISRSSDRGVTTRHFGLSSDIPVRGDFDGDDRTDIAVFRPSNGVWYIQKSSDSGYIFTQFGLSGDIPVTADFDGDNRTDIAVFRPSNGTWYWLRSSDGAFRAMHFGMNGDIPVTGDFDGDGADDVSVFRPSTGIWYSWRSSNETLKAVHFGMNGDVPVAGNYDSDGITDVAVFRPSTGVWYILRSSGNGFESHYFGVSSDIPVIR